jgi:DNA replication and repair protein RecF
VHLTHLQLVDFRSYRGLELTLQPGASVFVGANGQGKTNLVEAVWYLATLGSHRVAGDAPLVRGGAERAVIRARLVREDRAAVVELEILPGKGNRARLNRAAVSRPRDIVGLLCAVMFAPEDLALVKGDPAGRRRFLDDLLVARTPRMAALRADYDRVLKQRSALLRTAGVARRGGGTGDLRTLDVWDGHLARHGAELILARHALVTEMRPRVARAYAAIAGLDGLSECKYHSSVQLVKSQVADSGGSDDPTGVALGQNADQTPGRNADQSLDRTAVEQAMLAELARVRGQEIDRGVSLVGPHRDELTLSIGGLPARGYASHGESWSLALALRLASFELLRDDGREPVLLLDDVFAELDASRRARLGELVAPADQVLVTAAVAADVPPGLAGAQFTVADGRVDRAG